MAKTYEQVHAGLFWLRGRASEHLCVGCGQPGVAWAYQSNAGEVEVVCPQGRRYSENLLDHYAPMCSSCHARLDHSPEYLAGLAAQGQAALAVLRATDEAWAEAARERARVAAEKARQAFAEQLKDPEVLATHQEQLRKNIAVARAAYADQRAADPAASEPLRQAGLKTQKMKRTCGECSLRTNPASLGYHQKTTGHRGHA